MEQYLGSTESFLLRLQHLQQGLQKFGVEQHQLAHVRMFCLSKLCDSKISSLLSFCLTFFFCFPFRLSLGGNFGCFGIFVHAFITRGFLRRR
jgi:hypothetical protein